MISNSKAKTETPAPDPQNPIEQPASPDSEIINDGDGGQMDTLNLENIKTVPSSEKRDNILNYGNNLPESISTSADSSDLKP